MKATPLANLLLFKRWSYSNRFKYGHIYVEVFFFLLEVIIELQRSTPRYLHFSKIKIYLGKR